MKLENVKDKIDNYFEKVDSEELYGKAIESGFKPIETTKTIITNNDYGISINSQKGMTNRVICLDDYPKIISKAMYGNLFDGELSKTSKFGFDFHGVLDSETKPYKNIAKALVSQGFDVYLITGTMKGDYLTKQLNSEGIYEGIHFNKFFSVSDYLIEQGFPCQFIREGNPYFGEIEEWDSAKGLFCAKEGIDLHFDDSVEYEKYFTTGFELVV